MKNSLKYYLYIFSWFLGLLLLLMNLSGEFVSLRSSDLDRNYSDDLTISEDQIYEVVGQNFASRDLYIYNVNSAVYKGISHSAWAGDPDELNLRVPFNENYLLFLASYIYPRVWERYEFSNPQKAIERGIGICSQKAIITTRLLANNGIETKVIGLDGHVVATSKVDLESNQWWIVDADYGVVIEHDIVEIEKDPEIIRVYYRDAGYANHTIDALVEIYGKEGNYVPSGVSMTAYHPNRLYVEYFEYLAYIMKWLIPIVFIIPFMRNRYYHFKELCRSRITEKS
jgi:hypothetical protein